MQPKFVRVNPSLLAIVIEGVCSRFSFGVIAFALPLYANELGLGYTAIGFLVSLNLAVGIAIKPFAGWAADRFGLKRGLILGTGLRTVVPLLLAIFAMPMMLYVARSVHGISGAVRDPSVDALIADHGGKKSIASAFAWYSTAKSVAGTLGHGATGILLALTASNYSLVFAMAFGTSVLSLLIVMMFVREVSPERRTKRRIKKYARELARFLDGVDPEEVTPAHVQSFAYSSDPTGKEPSASTVSLRLSAISGFFDFARRQGLVAANPASGVKRPKLGQAFPTGKESGKETPGSHAGVQEGNKPSERQGFLKDILPFMGLGFFITSAGQMFHGYFPLLAKDYAGLNEAQSAMIYVVSSFTILFAGPIFGWLSDHVSRKLVLLTRGIANVASSVIYLVAPNLAGIVSGKIVDDVGKAAFRPAWGAVMAQVSSFDRRHRARTMSYLSSGLDGGEIAGPLLTGLLLGIWATPFGFQVVFGGRIVLAIVAELYSLALVGQLRKLEGHETKVVLIVERGVPEVSSISLGQSGCLFGRTPPADLVLDNPYVSRRHAQIVRQGSRFRIRDCGSKNGTFVNGLLLQGNGQWLQSGDRIKLGHSQIVLRFQEKDA